MRIEEKIEMFLNHLGSSKKSSDLFTQKPVKGMMAGVPHPKKYEGKIITAMVKQGSKKVIYQGKVHTSKNEIEIGDSTISFADWARSIISLGLKSKADMEKMYVLSGILGI